MEATLSFNACHVRCVRIAADIDSKQQAMTAPINSRSDTWQRPAFRRTLPVHHSVRRPTSYPHKLQHFTVERQELLPRFVGPVQVCVLCWQASLIFSVSNCLSVCSRMPLRCRRAICRACLQHQLQHWQHSTAAKLAV